MRGEEEKERGWLGDPYGEQGLALWLLARPSPQTFVHSSTLNQARIQEHQHAKRNVAAVRRFQYWHVDHDLWELDRVSGDTLGWYVFLLTLS